MSLISFLCNFLRTGIAVFIAIAIIFAITQHFILAYVKQSNKETRARALHLDITQIIVSIAQYVPCGNACNCYFADANGTTV